MEVLACGLLWLWPTLIIRSSLITHIAVCTPSKESVFMSVQVPAARGDDSAIAGEEVSKSMLELFSKLETVTRSRLSKRF